MDIEVTRPVHGWTERALSFMPGTVVQYLSAAGATVRARCTGDSWQVQQTPAGNPRCQLSGSGLLRDLGDAPRLRVLAPA